MAKDPAVLFYTQDFLTGTLLMTDAQRGKYITLLCLQHQNGKLTEKDMLKVCKKPDPEIWSKFTQQDGFFINKRMLIETQKRNKYTTSRRENLKQNSDSHMDTHMESHMDDHMENEIIRSKELEELKKKKELKKFVAPTENEVIAYFKEKGYKIEIAKRAFLYYSEQDWHDSRGKPIKNWKGKMVAVWFKEENKAQDTRGTIDLTQLRNERKTHQ